MPIKVMVKPCLDNNIETKCQTKNSNCDIFNRLGSETLNSEFPGIVAGLSIIVSEGLITFVPGDLLKF